MRTIGAKKSDAQIQSDVLRELKWDTRINAPEIGVEVRAGVVSLTGVVDSWARRVAAQKAAHRVEGALDVANEIEVRPVGSLARDDADVARAVRAALEWDVRVPDARIRSTVSDGEVSLEGTVDLWSEREDAEKAVRYLAGVKGVTNVIAVAPRRVAASDVRAAIVDALERQALREARRIDMDIVDGRVTLSGVIRSWAEHEAAVGAAGATPGVREVDDRLRIEPWS